MKSNANCTTKQKQIYETIQLINKQKLYCLFKKNHNNKYTLDIEFH